MIPRTTIEAIAQRIASQFQPRSVMLFGSHARGEATEHSDVDLLVVLDNPGPRGRRSAPILKMLAMEFPYPVDVVVRSPESLEAGRRIPGSFAEAVVREGVVLYDRGG